VRTVFIYKRFKLLWQLIANVDPVLGDITVQMWAVNFSVCARVKV
jgi:hypothetical protein